MLLKMRNETACYDTKIWINKALYTASEPDASSRSNEEPTFKRRRLDDPAK